MPTRTSEYSRREFLKSGRRSDRGLRRRVALTETGWDAQGPFDTHASHIDPKKLDSWVAVGADGPITAHTGKCDFGQGIFTAQTQLVAEELCVPVSRVRLIQCDTGDHTGPRNDIRESIDADKFQSSKILALAAATAREALLQLAAAKFGSPVDKLNAADGVITVPPGAALPIANWWAASNSTWR